MASNSDRTDSVTGDLSKLERVPTTYQELNEFFIGHPTGNPFLLRKETFLRIEKITKTPLICYVTKTRDFPPSSPAFPQGIPAYINEADLVGFGDLIQSIKQNVQPTELGPVDIFVISNGGIAEATERIVRALRRQFNTIRFIVPSNAFSAATLLCFSGDSIIMDSFGTLGPIDPQVGDKPARVILRAFDEVKRILKEEGPQALAAYLPLISKYDLPIIEICKTAEQLSKELATNWLSTYMFKCNEEDERVTNIVEFFSNYDLHKSHGRSIDRETARELGLRVTNVESIVGLSDLVRSLYNQYELLFDRTPYYKIYENAHGINWGRQYSVPHPVPLFPTQVPPGPPPGTPPGPPQQLS